MHTDFNAIAPFYDGLAKLMYRTKLNDAKVHFLNQLKPNQTILVLGGGTGWLLEQLDALNLSLKVTFVEASPKMIRYAKKRKVHNLSIEFEERYFDASFLSEVKYDVVFTNFFLDLFEGLELKRLIQHISTLIVKDGTWILTDFYLGKKSSWRKHLLLWFMYRFFNLFSGLKTKKLEDFKVLIEAEGCIQREEHFYMRQFIQSRCFLKG